MKLKHLISLAAVCFFNTAIADEYALDIKGAHASINFKVQHLGYSWLTGRFNTFDGDLTYDPKKPEASKISVVIDTASVDSNHARRDKHLRSNDFLDVKKYPKASFESTKVTVLDNGDLAILGDFTFHGVTKPLTINASKIGEGKSPWGDYRVGFEGTTSFLMKDYGVEKDLGPASARVYLDLHIEAIKQ